MPRISHILGLSIYMYWYDNKKHFEPHIHIIHHNKTAVFSLEGKLLAGHLHKPYNKIIVKFIKNHQKELMLNWNKALQGKELKWIKPKI